MVTSHTASFPRYLLCILESIFDSTEAYWGSRISFNVESYLLKYKYKYCKCPIILNTFLFLFSNKMLVRRTGIDKMLVRIANRKDLLQKQSDLGLHCLSMPLSFWKANSVQNFTTFTAVLTLLLQNF